MVMLTKKENLEAVEKFAENLEVEGRSLWQDAASALCVTKRRW